MIPGVTTPKTESHASGRPQFGAHHRRRLARPAHQFPGPSGPAADSRSGARNLVQLAAARRRRRSLPGSVRRFRRARARGSFPRRQEVVFVEQAVAASRALQEQLTRLGGEPRAGGGNGCRALSACRREALRHRVFGSALRRNALAEYVPLLDAGRWLKRGAWCTWKTKKPRGHRRCRPHWELLKSKSAGEVGYHLARVIARAQVNA